MAIDLSGYQKRLFEWQNKNFGRQPDALLGLGIAEEAGEVCHAILKRSQRIRGFEDKEKYLSAIADGVVDNFVFGLNLLSNNGIEIEPLLEAVFEHVLSRDWKKNTLDAGTGDEEIILPINNDESEEEGSVFEH